MGPYIYIQTRGRVDASRSKIKPLPLTMNLPRLRGRPARPYVELAPPRVFSTGILLQQNGVLTWFC